MVDDDPQTLRYVRDALAAAGFVPLVTGDPREFAYLLQTHRPQLVLLDLMLPGADGIELLEDVPELADLPVIFLSGYGRDETNRPGVGSRSRRLHRQALLADGADGESAGGPASAGGDGTLRAGRPRVPLRATPGAGGRAGRCS